MRNGTCARALDRSDDATSHGHVVQLLLTALRHDKLISSSSLPSSPLLLSSSSFFVVVVFISCWHVACYVCVWVCSSEQCDAATRKKPSKFSAFLKLVPTSAARSQKERKKERKKNFANHLQMLAQTPIPLSSSSLLISCFINDNVNIFFKSSS